MINIVMPTDRCVRESEKYQDFAREQRKIGNMMIKFVYILVDELETGLLEPARTVRKCGRFERTCFYSISSNDHLTFIVNM